MAYASKLDDFESFVAHAKLAGLTLGPSTASLDSGGANAAAQNPSSQQVFLATSSVLSWKTARLIKPYITRRQCMQVGGVEYFTGCACACK